MHARRSLLYHNQTPWIKKENNSDFDITMGSWNGAECCEIVGLFLLNQIKELINEKYVGLYRDDGLAALPNLSGPQTENLKKKTIHLFKQNNLSIEIQTGLYAVDYLDVTLDLKKNTYKPYNKPNNKPNYVNKLSNHPPQILKQIPLNISKRLSDNSSTPEIFNEVAPFYNQLLRENGYEETITYTPPKKETTKKNKRKQRDIIWYNPPFILNV